MGCEGYKKRLEYLLFTSHDTLACHLALGVWLLPWEPRSLTTAGCGWLAQGVKASRQVGSCLQAAKTSRDHPLTRHAEKTLIKPQISLHSLPKL